MLDKIMVAFTQYNVAIDDSCSIQYAPILNIVDNIITSNTAYKG